MPTRDDDLPEDARTEGETEEPARAEELDLPPEAEKEVEDVVEKPAPGFTGFLQTSD